MPIRRNLQSLAAILLVMAAGACGDSPTASEAGTIRLSVQTVGGDPDLNGYEIVIGASPHPRREYVGPNTSARLTGVSAGTHTVTLDWVAENCVVDGPNPRLVRVGSGETTDVSFRVSCETTGIVVTSHTTGADVPDSYDFAVTGQPSTRVSANGSTLVSRLPSGTHTVALILVGGHCTVTGGPKQTVQVSSRSITPVLFEVMCGPLVRLEKIAYTVDVESVFGLERWIGLVKLDGTDDARLALGYSPAWSPDGSRLVFSTTYLDIYYGLPCTGGLVVMDPETRSVSTLETARCGSSPAWAPTGDAIAFRRCCEPPADRSQLYLVKLDGSPAVSLPTPGVLIADAPSWSPDGKRIAYECFVTPGIWSVCIVNRDGTEPLRLTTDDVMSAHPAWSPDGNRIAFDRYDETTRRTHITVMNLEDRSTTQLTPGWDPAWSPDGTKLVFADGDALYTINVDGSNRTHLAAERRYAAAWRP
jgi:hypothetical protein